MRISQAAVGTATLLALAALLASFAPLRAVSAAHGTPSAGYTIHIDAQKHFTHHNTEWAHHWCKAVANGMLECLIFPSDDNNAPMVATEIIVQPKMYKSFSPSERALWHYHKTEIPKVNAKMPDVSAAAAKKMVAQITDTYGKIYVLYDPMDTKLPIGKPVINVLEGNQK